MLCQTCVLMLRGQEGRQWKGTYDLHFQHHRDLDSLVRSAGRDCNICRVLCEELGDAFGIDACENWGESARWTERLKDELSKHSPELDDSNNALSSASLSVLGEPGNEGGEEVYRLDFKLRRGDLLRRRTFVLNPIKDTTAPFRTPTMDNTESGEVFRLALTWMEKCECMEDSDDNNNDNDDDDDPPWRPKRLIDLSDLKSEVYSGLYRAKKHNNAIKSQTVYTGKNKHPDDLEVKLIDTKSGVPQSNRPYYVTLSHRWGEMQENKRCKLTKANLEDFQRGLKLRDLPKTFRDAVEFAAKLHNVQYIWIDSLCIIQDSPEDWLAQSSQMHQVYSKSFLNISATAAENSQQGLYTKRDPKLLWEVEVNLNIEGLPGSKAEKERNDMMERHRARTQQLRSESSLEPEKGWSTYDLGSRRINMSVERPEAVRRCTLIDVSYSENLVNRASVNKRGWVLQERLLAPRVLHFCQGQIAWECPEYSTVEGLPSGLPNFQRLRDDTVFAEIPLKGLNPTPHGKALRKNRLKGTPEPDLHLIQDTASEEKLYALEIWHRIVEMYMKTELTLAKDKLPALSGIANSMSKSIGCNYIAGLWDWHMPSQLLWRVEPVFTSTGRRFNHYGKRPRDATSGKLIYRAPSFSWASLDAHDCHWTTCGEVTDQDILVEYKSAVVAQSADQKGDEFGQVSEGHVTLWGSAFKISLYGKKNGSHAWKFDRADVNGRNCKNPRDIIEEEHTNVYLDCPHDDDTEHHIFRSEDTYCLPVARGERRDTEEGKYVICLLLKREDRATYDHVFGTFRRIGVTKLSSWADKHGRKYMLQCTGWNSNGEMKPDAKLGQQLLDII